MDPDPIGEVNGDGFAGPWRGGYFTSLEGSNRVPCIIRWPGKISPGKVSNELVHEVGYVYDAAIGGGGPRFLLTGRLTAWTCGDFLLGDAAESGRDTILCFQGNRLQAVKWRQWKMHIFRQDEFLSTWTPYNVPHIHNLEWDPREERAVDFPHGWVVHPMAAAAAAFLKTLTIELPIKPGYA